MWVGGRGVADGEKRGEWRGGYEVGRVLCGGKESKQGGMKGSEVGPGFQLLVLGYRAPRSNPHHVVGGTVPGGLRAINQIKGRARVG